MLVYLDNSATTRQYDEVTSLMVQTIKEEFGNPSSLHRMGMAAEKALKEARRQTAAALGAKEEEIYFTGSGTEGANMAVFGAAEARRRHGNKVITTQVEHPAVLEAVKKLERKGFETVFLPVDRHGTVDLNALEAALDEKTILVSIMHVNNELGTVEPIEEAGRIIRQAEQKHKTRILFHSDAVQAFGKVPLAMGTSPVDLLTVSGHKIHGPKGTGAIFIREGVRLEPLVVGGGHEKGMRSGTENVPGLCGLGLAAQMMVKDGCRTARRTGEMRDYLKGQMIKEIADVEINSPEGGLCCPTILNASFPGCKGEVLLHKLEQKGIYVSTGSACASKKKGSHVLTASGLSPAAVDGAIRFSLSEFITREEIDYTVTELKEAVSSMRKLVNAFGKGRRNRTGGER